MGEQYSNDYWNNSDEMDEGYPQAGYEPDEDYDSYDLYAQEEEEFDHASGYEPEEARPISLPSLSSLFANGPGPGMVVMAALLMCLVLAGTLLTVTGGISSALTAAGEAAQAIATQVAEPAAQQPGAADPAIPADCTVSDLFPNKVRRWCGLISQYASKHELPPDLVAALIWLESGGNEIAYSRSGAVGLMQVMPSDGIAATFTCINGPCFSDRPTTAQLQDPEFNIAFGTRMLAGLIRRNGGLREALKSYGPMDVGYTYADKVIGIFERHTK